MKLIFNAANNKYLLDSLILTFKFAFGILVVSFVLRVILALLKTYGGKIFSAIVTIYVEIFRNTSMLLWLCVCFIALPIPNKYVRAASGLTLVSTAVICEIVRGGLNSIHKGQIATAEFLYTVKRTMATSTVYTGHSVTAMDVFIMFGFAALVYLMINICLSGIARVADRKLNSIY